MTTPIELYQFNLGGDDTFVNYTSHDHDVVYLGDTYTVEPIRRAAVNVKDEISKLTLDVTMSLDNTVVRGWYNDPDQRVILTVFRQDALYGTIVMWKGRLVNIKPGTAEFVLSFESVFTSLKRPGLRARFSLNCRHPLYGPGCNISAAAFGTTFSVTAVSADELTLAINLAAVPAGDYFTGMIRWGSAYRMITQQTTTSVTVSRPLRGLAAAVAGGPVSVTLYPGCDRSMTRCVTRFNNRLNNGAFRFIPIRNPFDGSSIV